MENIRQPIVTIAGHIDHGKTTILDSIRATAVAAKEAGGITQKISFTTFPYPMLEARCKVLLDKYKIKAEIPGFLFIDTPGHAAFTNLRKRGGALADLAILVIDINEGLMPQTFECIEILRAGKTPFVVALNKIDAIAGWRKNKESIEESLKSQSEHTKKDFEKKLYKIISSLATLGFDSDLFFRIEDFTKKLALVPCSGKTGEGITELLVMLLGLSQRFLRGKLKLSEEAKGTILEIKKEKGLLYSEAILYDGSLEEQQYLIIASFDKPVIAKIRAIFAALPLGKGFEHVKKVNAATGLRLQLVAEEEIAAGMPFLALDISNKAEVEKKSKELKQEVGETIKLDKEGITAKADSLGSLEALLFLLRKEGFKIANATIGNVTKNDVAAACSLAKENPLHGAIVAFNTQTEESVKALAASKGIALLEGDIIYRLLEQLKSWHSAKEQELLKTKLEKLSRPCKLSVLRYVFRQSNPAIFGVRVEAGILRSDMLLMNKKGKILDKVKSIQKEKKVVESAKKGEEVAISLQDVIYGRQVKEKDILYSCLSEDEFRELKASRQYLSDEELGIMEEIAEIKRKEKPTWGI